MCKMIKQNYFSWVLYFVHMTDQSRNLPCLLESNQVINELLPVPWFLKALRLSTAQDERCGCARPKTAGPAVVLIFFSAPKELVFMRTRSTRVSFFGIPSQLAENWSIISSMRACFHLSWRKKQLLALKSHLMLRLISSNSSPSQNLHP